MEGRVLTIGRSDCLAESGVQRDLRTVEAMGGRAATVVANLTARDLDQSLEQVELPATFIVRQIDRIFAEGGAAAIKIGRLSSEEQIDIVANVLEQDRGEIPLVMAPNLFRLDDTTILTHRALAHWKRRLAHMAKVLVVNAAEAEALSGLAIGDSDERRHAAEMMASFGCEAVLLVAADEGGGICLFVDGEGLREIKVPIPDLMAERQAPAILAAAVAAGLAAGEELRAAVERGCARLGGLLSIEGL